ncbi:MAG: plastocyanin/azurin family copper-binding protein [Opitutaceae bacterium]
MAAALVFAGCSKKGNSAADSAAPDTVAAAGANAAAATTAETKTEPAVTVLQLSGNDQMKFSVTRLEAKAGATVRVVLTNTGTLPKVAMGHNFVLLKKGVDPVAYSMQAAAAQATDYVPAARSGDVIAHTRLIGPKEKAEVTFTAPTEPGEYTYLCTFPGHFAAGMKGVLVVQ